MTPETMNDGGHVEQEVDRYESRESCHEDTVTVSMSHRTVCLPYIEHMKIVIFQICSASIM